MMETLSAPQLGSRLQSFLSTNDELVGLEAWADRLYLDHRFSPEVGGILQQLSATGMGAEFEYTREELEALAGVLASDDPIAISGQIRGSNAQD